MDDQFTTEARRVVELAEDEARHLKHNYVDTAHLVLGLLRQETGVAATILAESGVEIEEFRDRLIRLVGQGVDELPKTSLLFVGRLEEILQLVSLREALSLGHDRVDTEHLLLGLIRNGEGMGYSILLDMIQDSETLRAAIVQRI